MAGMILILQALFKNLDLAGRSIDDAVSTVLNAGPAIRPWASPLLYSQRRFAFACRAGCRLATADPSYIKGAGLGFCLEASSRGRRGGGFRVL